ncbi:MAG: hypothetical protein KGH67_05520 [Candidatus Micrarchaeota archaeon]|nr:hypothetical protein [Candidatus Micrarchaeota archaeon]
MGLKTLNVNNVEITERNLARLIRGVGEIGNISSLKRAAQIATGTTLAIAALSVPFMDNAAIAQQSVTQFTVEAAPLGGTQANKEFAISQLLVGLPGIPTTGTVFAKMEYTIKVLATGKTYSINGAALANRPYTTAFAYYPLPQGIDVAYGGSFLVQSQAFYNGALVGQGQIVMQRSWGTTPDISVLPAQYTSGRSETITVTTPGLAQSFPIGEAPSNMDQPTGYATPAPPALTLYINGTQVASNNGNITYSWMPAGTGTYTIKAINSTPKENAAYSITFNASSNTSSSTSNNTSSNGADLHHYAKRGHHRANMRPRLRISNKHPRLGHKDIITVTVPGARGKKERLGLLINGKQVAHGTNNIHYAWIPRKLERYKIRAVNDTPRTKPVSSVAKVSVRKH